MSDDDRWKAGGYTRNCPDCGHQWAVEDLAVGADADRQHVPPSMRQDPGPCPECGYEADPDEETWAWNTCPGCGDAVPADGPPTVARATPDSRQWYCSVAHARPGANSSGGSSSPGGPAGAILLLLVLGTLAFIGLSLVALAVVLVYAVAPGAFGIGAHDAFVALFWLLVAGWWTTETRG